MYKSILQIALLSWIYMLLSPPRETGLAINFAQGSVVPWSENKCWSIIVLCLPPYPPRHPCLPPQSLYKPRGLLVCVCRLMELNGTGGVEVCESVSAVRVLTDIGVTERWCGCWYSTSRFSGHTAAKQKQGHELWSTASWLVWLQCIQHLFVSTALMPKHNSHQDVNSGQPVRGKISQSSVSGCCQTSSSTAPKKCLMLNKCLLFGVQYENKNLHYCENVTYTMRLHASAVSFYTTPTNVWMFGKKLEEIRLQKQI